MAALLLLQAVFAQKPLPNAHAHNDYEHKMPLYDALGQGFTSVEADVWLIDGELYVSHKRPGSLTGISLRELYLMPLQQRLKANGSRVYPGYEGVFFLMIDIKAQGIETYKVLRKQLLQYSDFQANPYFKVFLSGDRPFEDIRKDSAKVVALDGRPEDLGKGYSPALMPVVSDTYRKFCRWNGTGTMPEGEFEIVKKLADQAHAEGKKLRLWAIPDNENAWKTLLKAGVDLINTDKLAELSRVLQAY